VCVCVCVCAVLQGSAIASGLQCPKPCSHHTPYSLPCVTRPCHAQLLALPSKRQGLYAPPAGCLIARSDTNGEDLAGYAGAGLYDRWGWFWP
jgi:hypothetical protein